MYHPIDVQVGARVRQRRTLLGMSQTHLGKAVGLTFQQVQKYENGANRISASRLYEFAKVLDVPVAFFFDAMPKEATRPSAKAVRPPKTKDDLTKRETLELVRAYYKITDPSVRKAIADMVRSMAQSGAK